MKPILVPAVKTVYTLEQLVHFFVKGYSKAFAITPSKESVKVLFAQVGIETGGSTSLWNNNYANLKIGDVSLDYPEQQYYMKLTGVWEIIGGKKVILDKENPGSWFRSFPTPEEGMATHLTLLRYKRYASAWTAVEAGNIPAFAHLLKLKMYYTAPETDYVKGMMYWAGIYDKHPEWYDAAVAELSAPISENMATQPIPPPLDSEDMVTDLNLPMIWDIAPETPDDSSSNAPEIQKTLWQKIKSILPG